MKLVSCRVGPLVPQACSIVGRAKGARVVNGGHGGAGVVDQSIRRGRLCPPYRLLASHTREHGPTEGLQTRQGRLI
jgi:hypothetical protein